MAEIFPFKIWLLVGSLPDETSLPQTNPILKAPSLKSDCFDGGTSLICQGRRTKRYRQNGWDIRVAQRFLPNEATVQPVRHGTTFKAVTRYPSRGCFDGVRGSRIRAHPLNWMQASDTFKASSTGRCFSQFDRNSNPNGDALNVNSYSLTYGEALSDSE